VRPRSLGRRLALQYLFMADLNGFSGVETPEVFFRFQHLAEREGVDGFKPDNGDPRRDEAENFALSLIQGALENLGAIDGDIGRAADNWQVARIGTIERNVLRLAAAELRLGGSPRRVVLDEAVELAKRFGDKDSGAFVNGVADSLPGGS
jgi:N utilization substance protein B